MHALAFPEVVIAIRTFIAAVFLTAAYAKMRHWQTFEGVVANYRLLPGAWIRPMTYALPVAEMLIGAGLLTAARGSSSWPEAAASVLLGIFAIAMTINIFRGRRHIDCGCFDGALKQTLRWSLVARNVVMMLLLGIAVSVGGTRAGVWELVTGACAGAAMFVVLQSLNALWAVAPVRRDPAHA